MRWTMLLSLVLAACSDGSDASPTPDALVGCSGFVGDRSRPVEIAAVVGELSGEAGPTVFRPVLATDGARVPLLATPMGGFMILAGARLRNIDTCTISVTAGLRDAAGRVMSTTRPLKMEAGADGWATAPGAGFDPAEPDLEDVYFRTLRGHGEGTR